MLIGEPSKCAVTNRRRALQFMSHWFYKIIGFGRRESPAPVTEIDQIRQLEKADVIGKRIVSVIVSMPDKPVTMSNHSYSEGFLQLDTGDTTSTSEPMHLR